MLRNPEFRNPTCRKRCGGRGGTGAVPCIRGDRLLQLGGGVCAFLVPNTLSQDLNVVDCVFKYRVCAEGGVVRRISLPS